MWEKNNSIYDVKEIRTRTTCYLGVGAIDKVDPIMESLSSMGHRKVLVVSGRSSYRTCWGKVLKAFEKHGMTYVHYDRITPNPTVDSVDEAARMAREFGATAVVAIGGGSPIDSAKSAAILMEYKDRTARDLYELKFTPLKAAPVVAINLTHGTGTEVDRFAVVSIPEKEYKPAIAYDCIYPLFAIDDPSLMTGLPEDQTRYVSIDALNHVIEACTTVAASPYSILLAKETVRLVAEYLPKALEDPKDLEARYYLLYASMIAGVAFDNGLLHYTHALEHPLSAVKPELPHGLGLAMIVPGVVKNIYPVRAQVLAEVLAPIVPGLEGDPSEAVKAAEGLEEWLFSVGVTHKLSDQGFGEEHVSKLVHLAKTTPSLDTLLSLAPVKATDQVIEDIYRCSLSPLRSSSVLR
ncbi:MAG: iron-containing alcohol dehydrogenase [Thermanaerothrix sp.]|nr:iron-containing alcohol dehydrogenase [Thermanaerothrix sp.]